MSADEREETGRPLRRVGAERTVIVVEHDMDIMRSFADSVTVLHAGKVLSEGTVAQVQPTPRSKEVYLGKAVQLRRRSRAVGGLAMSRKLERGPKRTKRVYPLQGRVRCAICERRMEGTPRAERTYYRCPARTLVPGSPVLAHHPKDVYLPEQAVLDLLGRLFAPENRDETVDQLLASAGATEEASAGE